MTYLRIDLPTWMVLGYAFIVGTVVGSFLNVCILRIPRHARFKDQLQSLWVQGSHCPRCQNAIRWYDNIPVLSWLWLRGRCRNCAQPISWRYPAIETLSGLLWVLVATMEIPLGISATLEQSCLFTDLGPQNFPGLGPLSPEWFVILRYLFHMVMIEALLVASVIDIDLRIIPDGATLPAMSFAVLISTLIGRMHLVPVWFHNPDLAEVLLPENFAWLHGWIAGSDVPTWISEYPHLQGLAVSVAGLLVGGLLIWFTRLCGFWFLHQEAMGLGDVILMAMIGAFLGWQAAIITFFIAPLCAIAAVIVMAVVQGIARLLFGKPALFETLIPYGPYLSLGALLTILFWKPLLLRTQHVFELGFLLLPFTAVMLVLFGGCLWAIYRVKLILGILAPEEAPRPWYEDFRLLFGWGPSVRPAQQWSSADQLWYFKGENVDRHTARWRSRDWEGCASGQGLTHEERWRRPDGRSGRPWGRSG